MRHGLPQHQGQHNYNDGQWSRLGDYYGKDGSRTWPLENGGKRHNDGGSTLVIGTLRDRLNLAAWYYGSGLGVTSMWAIHALRV